MFAFTSDYRIKKDVLDLPGMWDTVKALRPIKYTQAEFTPPSQVRCQPGAKSGRNDAELCRAGPRPMSPTTSSDGASSRTNCRRRCCRARANGEKDSHDTVQSPNWAPLVAALTKALQEAMTRIEALEAG